MEINNKLNNKEEKEEETKKELTENEFIELNKDISQALIEMKKEKDNSEENIDSDDKDSKNSNVELDSMNYIFENDCIKNLNSEKNNNFNNADPMVSHNNNDIDKLTNSLNNIQFENKFNKFNTNKIYPSNEKNSNSDIYNLNIINENNISQNIENKYNNERNNENSEKQQGNINNLIIQNINNNNINLNNIFSLNNNLFSFNNNILNNFNCNIDNNGLNINNLINIDNDRNNNFLGNNNINLNNNYNLLNNINLNEGVNFKNLFSPSPSFSAGKHLESAELSKNIINLESILKGKDKRTTLIIRNIPIRYSISILIKELNNKFFHKFDVVYLPQDYTNNFNLGFGFINFIEPIHLVSFCDKYEGKKWNCFHSNKRSQLAYSKYQGRKELIKYIYKKLGISEHSNNKENLKKSFYISDNEKFEKPPIEIPMKFYNKFKKYYPYSLCHNKNNNIFIVDNFYNF